MRRGAGDAEVGPSPRRGVAASAAKGEGKLRDSEVLQGIVFRDKDGECAPSDSELQRFVLHGVKEAIVLGLVGLPAEQCDVGEATIKRGYRGVGAEQMVFKTRVGMLLLVGRFPEGEDGAHVSISPDTERLLTVHCDSEHEGNEWPGPQRRQRTRRKDSARTEM